MTFIQAPKRVRQVDSTVTQQARERDGVCLYGLLHKDGCWNVLDGHHMDPVGTGGDDVIENVISLCRKHHTMAEDRRITKRELQAIMTLYHGYKYPGVVAWTRKEYVEARK